MAKTLENRLNELETKLAEKGDIEPTHILVYDGRRLHEVYELKNGQFTRIWQEGQGDPPAGCALELP